MRIKIISALLVVAAAAAASAAPTNLLYQGSDCDGYDQTTRTNASLPCSIIAVLGTNGATIADGESASVGKGTDFGLWGSNSVSTNWFWLTNSGSADMSISGITTNGAGAAQFSIGGVPSGVVAGAVSNFWIAFAPLSLGVHTAVVSIANSSTTTPYRVNVKGTGATGVIALTPVSLDFTATYGGASPISQNFSVSNSGQIAFGYTNTITYGAGASGWLNVTATSGTVAAAASQTHVAAVVSITGLNAGIYHATNTVTSGGATNSPRTLPVTLVVNPTINATAGAHGAIVPSGTVAVPYGGSTNFVVTADTGCWISSVETNGVAVPAAAGSQIYTSQWQNVTASGSITATFVVRRFGGGDNDGYDNGSASNLSILSTMPRGTVYKLR